MNDTIAIVVTYNRAPLLDECISALLSSSYPTDILVVDNASTDGTLSVVNKYGELIRYFNTGANLGGAGGFNVGLKKAFEMGYKYFWLMDDDTIVEPESLERIIKSLELLGREWGFISSKALWHDGNRCIMNGHSIDVSWESEIHLLQEGLLRVNTATFVSFFISREVVADVGLPIKEYFIWGDDTEYSLRISQRYPSYYCDRSIVIHKMQNNQGSFNIAELNDEGRIKRKEWGIRNDICTFRRLRGNFRAFVLVLRYVRQVVEILTMKKVEYRFLKVKVIVKGLFKGFFFSPEVEKVVEQEGTNAV